MNIKARSHAVANSKLIIGRVHGRKRALLRAESTIQPGNEILRHYGNSYVYPEL